LFFETGTGRSNGGMAWALSFFILVSMAAFEFCLCNNDMVEHIKNRNQTAFAFSPFTGSSLPCLYFYVFLNCFL
jgi:hypothetical protein